jgi:hypothetical protein
VVPHFVDELPIAFVLPDPRKGRRKLLQTWMATRMTLGKFVAGRTFGYGQGPINLYSRHWTGLSTLSAAGKRIDAGPDRT